MSVIFQMSHLLFFSLISFDIFFILLEIYYILKFLKPIVSKKNKSLSLSIYLSILLFLSGHIFEISIVVLRASNPAWHTSGIQFSVLTHITLSEIAETYSYEVD